MTLLVDQLDVFDQPVECLALSDVGAYRGHLLSALELLPHFGRVLVEPLCDACEFLVEVLVRGLDLLGVGDGPQREVDLHGLDRELAQLVDELLLRLTGGLRGTARP